MLLNEKSLGWEREKRLEDPSNIRRIAEKLYLILIGLASKII